MCVAGGWPWRPIPLPWALRSPRVTKRPFRVSGLPGPPACARGHSPPISVATVPISLTTSTFAINMPLEKPILIGVAAAVGVASFVWWRRRKALSEANSCCPPGSLPALATLNAEEAPAKGSERDVSGLTVYVTGKSNDLRCVMVMTDIWGFKAGRHRQVCDVLAASLGCQVFMPDLFHGTPCTPESAPGTPGFGPWVKQWSPSRVTADLDALMATFPPSCRVGVVGFCWGTFPALMTSSGWVSADVKATCFAHPSHRKVMENMHGMAPEDVGEYYLGAVRVPTLCLTAGNDDARCKPNGTDEKILKLADVPTKFVEFEGMSHGWIIKGDMADAEVAKGVTRAVALITEWLAQHLM